jgi:hypothetical protein
LNCLKLVLISSFCLLLTGNRVPESCIFSQFVNASAYLFAFTIYIRYKQIEQYYRDHLALESAKILKVNYAALVIGFVSCLGLSIVANFQEMNMRPIHWVGAIVCFSCGLMYCGLQTWMSYRMHPLVNTRAVAHYRLALTCIMFCSFVTALVLGPIAISHFHGPDRSRWRPEDGGYYMHMIAAINEWITAFCLNFFLLSYTREMLKISVSSPKIFIVVDRVSLMNDRSDNENALYQNEGQVEVVRGARSSSQSIVGRSDNGLTANRSLIY